jgi:hypothetical protein
VTGIDPAAAREVAAFESLDLDALRREWRLRYGAPPSLRSPELLGLMLAWRIQANREGGIDADVRRGMRRRGDGAPARAVGAGVLLAREWQGVRHEATALADGGFVYDGVRYASLSQIARLITGSRWNGPRFFGLRGADK